MADVVSLFAITKQSMVKALANAPAHSGKAAFFTPLGGGEIARINNKNSAATKLLAPEMTTGCQSISLINKPLVLQKKAVARTAPCPAIRFSRGVFWRIRNNSRIAAPYATVSAISRLLTREIPLPPWRY